MRIGIDSYSFHRYFGEVYPDHACVNCQIEDGDAIVVADANDVAGLDFSLGAPAQIGDSLVASAIMTPRRTAARVGSSPAALTIADMTQSADRSAASIRPAGPAATSISDPLRASLSES